MLLCSIRVGRVLVHCYFRRRAMPTWAENLASTAAKAAVEACINGKGTGKGKGKNQDAGGAKGKASGKGTTSTNKVPLKPGQWLCDWASCKWAIDMKPNHAYCL